MFHFYLYFCVCVCVNIFRKGHTHGTQDELYTFYIVQTDVTHTTLAKIDVRERFARSVQKDVTFLFIVKMEAT